MIVFQDFKMSFHCLLSSTISVEKAGLSFTVAP